MGYQIHPTVVTLPVMIGTGLRRIIGGLFGRYTTERDITTALSLRYPAAPASVITAAYDYSLAASQAGVAIMLRETPILPPVPPGVPAAVPPQSEYDVWGGYVDPLTGEVKEYRIFVTSQVLLDRDAISGILNRPGLLNAIVSYRTRFIGTEIGQTGVVLERIFAAYDI